MPTSIRLDPRTDALLRRLTRQRGETKSEVIRAAIGVLAGEPKDPSLESRPVSALDRIAHVVGIADSEGAALSVHTGEGFRTILRTKHHGRHSR